MQITENKWLKGLLLVLGLLGLNILWFAPSPLLTIIMNELNISLMQGGIAISVVCLVIPFVSFFTNSLVRRYSESNVFLAGLWLMGIGATMTVVAHSYFLLFITRLIIGAGFGMCLPLTGSMIMMWFTEKERPYVNTINSVLPYVATAITFSLITWLYFFLKGSWRLTIASFGIYMIIVAIAWMFFSRNSSLIKNNEQMTQGNLIFSILKNKQVILLSIAEAGDMWSFQLLTSYLPTYYIQEVKLDIMTSSNLTAIFPIAGIIAGLLCGVWMGKVGLRKPFTWPLHLMIFAGTFLAINGSGLIRVLGISLAGFGNAGWAPALFTMPMEFEGMTPSKVGAVYTLMLSLGFLSAFVSPLFGGFIAEHIGLNRTIFYFSFSSVIAAIATFLMKETGPARKRLSEGIVNG